MVSAKRPSRRSLPALIALLLVVLPLGSARADGQISSVRLGTHPQYDRLVFELGPRPIEVYRSESGDLQLEFSAAPPPVDATTARKLAVIGVQIATNSLGTTVRVDARGRPVRAFRLPVSADAPQSGERVVLDVAKGPEPLAAPPPNVLAIAPVSTRVVTAPAEPPRVSTAPPAAPPANSAAQLGSAAATSQPRPSTADEQVWVRVQSIAFEGLRDGAPTREDLLNLELRVRPIDNGDLVAARDAQQPEVKLLLRDLPTSGSGGRRVGGTVLQQVVERIAGAYEMQGKFGTRIDIARDDLARLLQGSEGVLKIRIMEVAQGS